IGGGIGLMKQGVSVDIGYFGSGMVRRGYITFGAPYNGMAQTNPLRNITDFKHLYFLENAHKSTISTNLITIFQRTEI
ncbi:MAG: hypothetical protein QM640_07140, partial [Niabella sp.]